MFYAPNPQQRAGEGGGGEDGELRRLAEVKLGRKTHHWARDAPSAGLKGREGKSAA
jgi:hypothetical protein